MLYWCASAASRDAPGPARRSHTVTSHPCRARYSDAREPAGPAPTTTARLLRGGGVAPQCGCCPCCCCAGGGGGVSPAAARGAPGPLPERFTPPLEAEEARATPRRAESGTWRRRGRQQLRGEDGEGGEEKEVRAAAVFGGVLAPLLLRPDSTAPRVLLLLPPLSRGRCRSGWRFDTADNSILLPAAAEEERWCPLPIDKRRNAARWTILCSRKRGATATKLAPTYKVFRGARRQRLKRWAPPNAISLQEVDGTCRSQLLNACAAGVHSARTAVTNRQRQPPEGADHEKLACSVETRGGPSS